MWLDTWFGGQTTVPWKYRDMISESTVEQVSDIVCAAEWAFSGGWVCRFTWVFVNVCPGVIAR